MLLPIGLRLYSLFIRVDKNDLFLLHLTGHRDLETLTKAEINMATDEINKNPKKPPGFHTPCEASFKTVASLTVIHQD